MTAPATLETPVTPPVVPPVGETPAAPVTPPVTPPAAETPPAAQTPEQKAAAEKAAAEQAAADKAAAEKAATEKAAAEKLAALHTPPVDGKYTLTLPKDATLPATALERTAALARSLGLSNDAAQQLVESTAAEVTATLAAEDAKFRAQVDTWKTETLADPKLGKTPEERTAAIQKGMQVIDKYGAANPDGAKALKAFLDTSGLGNHPAAVGLFAWLGKAAGEGPLVLGAGGEAGLIPTKDLMYPKGAARTEAEVAADAR